MLNESETIYNEQLNNIEKFKLQYSDLNYDWVIESCNNLSVGDIIITYFSPLSQKYIYDLYPIYGKIIEISKQTENIDDIIDTIKLLDENGNIISASHLWTSYFGNSRGYDYTVYKLIQKK